MAFITPDLPYAYDALEPWIDEATMKVHHDKHHVAYTTNLNAAVETTPLASWSAEELVARLAEVPENIRMAVRNHGGGHFNHSLFWETLGPKAGGKPEGRLAAAVDASFGSFDEFVKLFSAAAMKRFGSGWAWLSVAADRRLEISSTANQDSPRSEGKKPILGLDVWEHAYYLKYQNRRAEYVDSFYHVIDWKKVGSLYESAL
ncbi:MAG: superoxide dismutase [Treponema sp. GWB1_62_6]|nr:MAG: superoxide dismutase [Treponema sp. GWC1_61_84]OHE72030.1 MAG: superoxide dismutase [Treponema sp. GWB1_62_6]OHE75743.1 MAG: superoxide dismutase [Treponema sp. RIFOXYC1_FULL_61_9]HCM28112.1 superoxide dismutase [Treponema sp.]